MVTFSASAPSTSVFGTPTFGSSSTNNIFGASISSQAVVPTIANPVPISTASPFKLGQNESQLNTSSTTNGGFKFGQDSQKPFQFGSTPQQGGMLIY